MRKFFGSLLFALHIEDLYAVYINHAEAGNVQGALSLFLW
jgi:hypothetical protein